jgi:hypothetical protein
MGTPMTSPIRQRDRVVEYIGRLEAARIALTAALQTLAEALPQDGSRDWDRLRELSAETIKEAWKDDSQGV